MPGLLIIIVLLMRIVQNVFVKQNSKYVPKNSVAYLKYTAIYIGCASIPAIILYLIKIWGGAKILYFGQTLLFASMAGVALAISSLCGFYALSLGTMAVNSLFSTAGLLVPTIAGIFLYGDYLTVWQYLSILIFFLGTYFLAGNSKFVFGKFTIKTLVVLVLNLLMNGVTMLAQTMFANEVPQGDVSLFSFLMFFSGFIVLIIILLVFLILMYNNKKEKSNNINSEFIFIPTKNDDLKIKPKVFLGVIILAVAVFIVNQLITSLASAVDPVILFSITCGGAMIISALVGMVIYKEKITKEGVLGIILGISSLIMIKVFAA